MWPRLRFPFWDLIAVPLRLNARPPCVADLPFCGTSLMPVFLFLLLVDFLQLNSRISLLVVRLMILLPRMRNDDS